MPSIWKILIFACLCLGVVPSWADDDDLGLEESERVVMDPDLTEKVKEEELLIEEAHLKNSNKEELVNGSHKKSEGERTVTTDEIKEGQNISVSQPLSPQENIIPDKGKSPQVLDSLQSTDSQILDSLGIRKLSKGINIFRYTTYYLKHQSPIAKTRMPPENSVQ